MAGAFHGKRSDPIVFKKHELSQGKHVIHNDQDEQEGIPEAEAVQDPWDSYGWIDRERESHPMFDLGFWLKMRSHKIHD